MNKLFFCFLALMIPVFSGTPKQEKTPNIKSSWSLNDNYLYLDVELDEGLKFAENYDTFVFPNGQPGIEMHFVPSKEASFVKEDCQLKDMTFSIIVFYDSNNHLVNYKIQEKCIYENAGWFTTKTSTSTSNSSGRVFNTDLDLSEKPIFIVDKDSTNRGYFVFKKI